MSKPISLICLSRSLSPMSHQLGSVGNESVINREPVRTPTGVRHVPMLSGNAIRHRMIRKPAAAWLVDRYGLSGHLTRDEQYLLYHGGKGREKSTHVSLQKLDDLMRLWPIIGLLGGTIPEAIVTGRLAAWRGILVCKENADRIQRLSGYELGPDLDRLAPASRFVGNWQYVRGELRNSTPGELPTDVEAIDADTKAKMTDSFPFGGTCVVTGAEWFHGFSIDSPTPVLIGCLLHSLQQWTGTMGGQSSRGHGQLDLSIDLSQVDDPAGCVAAYVDAVDSQKGEAIEILHSLYSKPAAKTKAKK